MASRRVRRRFEGPSSDNDETTDDGDSLYALRSILLTQFQKMSLFDRYAATARLLSRNWRDAVDEFVESLHLSLDEDSRMASDLKKLTRFQNLTSLTLDKTVGCTRCDGWFSLFQLPRLKSLCVRGLLCQDRDLMSCFWQMNFLDELKLEIPTVDHNHGPLYLAAGHHLKSLAIRTASGRASRFPARIWNAFTGLESLAIEIEAPCAHIEAHGLLDLQNLESLRVSAPLFEEDVHALSGLTRLKSLVIYSKIILNLSENVLSHMTQLTRLEFATRRILLPQWLRNFTSLKCLSLTWNHGSFPGLLLPKILPASLTCLTLHNFQRGLKADVFAPLTALEKLSVSHMSSGDDDNAFAKLTDLRELYIRVGSHVWRHPLPDVSCMKGLRSLFVESCAGLESRFINAVATTLKKLRHLTIGSDLDDADLSTLTQLKGLESLTLYHCAKWTWSGLAKLDALEYLTDLSLFHCCRHLEQAIGMIQVGFFPSLLHFGVFPVDEWERNAYPAVVSVHGRCVKVDGNCRVHVYFDGTSASTSYC